MNMYPVFLKELVLSFMCMRLNAFVLFLHQLRNTLKFLLGNLQGFDPRVQAVDPKEMHYIDQYMLHLLREYSIKVSSGVKLVDLSPNGLSC